METKVLRIVWVEQSQVVYELRELKAPYWFNNDEVARIQQLNLNYMAQKDIGEMVEACFRKPKEGETVKTISGKEMLQHMKLQYPSLQITHSTKVNLGKAMKDLGYEHKEHSHVAYYLAVPLKAA